MGNGVWQWAAPVLVAVAIGVAAGDASQMYLRREPHWLVVALLAGGLGLAFGFTRRSSMLVRAVPLAGWVVYCVASVTWSLTPAPSVGAAFWALGYLGAFMVAVRWPRPFLVVSQLVSLWILAQGVDILLVTGSSHLEGIWFNKNIQGAHLLLLVPFVGGVAAKGSRLSPYAGLMLGGLLFYALLTRALAPQVLLTIGLVGLLVLYRHSWSTARTRRITALATMALAVAGFLLAWSTVRPAEVQVFGRGVGTTEVSRLDKTNTAASLGHRLEMAGYGVEMGRDSLPLGTGFGSTRDLYPGMKKKAGLIVPDLHNYYVQLFMTVGPIGLFLFVLALALPMFIAFRQRAWSVLVPTFLFAGYLAFDVAGYFPPLMLLFFGMLGVAAGTDTFGTRSSYVGMGRGLRGLYLVGGLVVAVAVPAAWWWWTQPCSDVDCLLHRRLASEDSARQVIGQLDGEKAIQVATSVREMYPRSVWAQELFGDVVAREQDPKAALEVRREIAQDFPAAHSGVYVQWWSAAREAGMENEAALARDQGSRYYDMASLLSEPNPGSSKGESGFKR